jgi:hypothetical protein
MQTRSLLVTQPIQIRPVTTADFPAWLPLWDAYNAFYGRSGETALPRDITVLTWTRFFDGYEPMHAMVAERDGQLLGLVHYLRWSGPFVIYRISIRWKASAAKVLDAH